MKRRFYKPPCKENRVRLNVRLPDEMVSYIRKIAQENGQTISDTVRALVLDGVKEFRSGSAI